ncbi:MAG: hypothetical protein IPO40_24350 [Fibrobacteres bacterium]|nr:hypothetical protein [Fibrobacterota bacterium]
MSEQKMSKDWENIISEFIKSEQLKNKDVNNFEWFLGKEDWQEFVNYFEYTTGYDCAGSITFMGVKFKQYQLNK